MRLHLPFALALLTLSAQTARAKELALLSVKTASGTLDPDDAQWRKATAVRVPLNPQIYVAPNGGGAVKWVDAQALHTTDALFLRLSWTDSTRNSMLGNSGRFTDACAVEFPARAGPPPSPFMGEKGAPVSLWMWRAVATETQRDEKVYSDFYRPGSIDKTLKFPDRPVQALRAEGFGTLAHAPIQDVEGASRWKDGNWSVVLKRQFQSKNGPVFSNPRAYSIAFAVWDGAQQERDGAKSVSPWHTLTLGAAAPAPPKSHVELGKRVFLRYGCATCHGPEGKGGVKNANAQGGEVPSLTKVAEGFSAAELEKVIREGRRSVPEDDRGPTPPLHMIGWKEVMDDTEIDALGDYLFSLMPKGEGETW